MKKLISLCLIMAMLISMAPMVMAADSIYNYSVSEKIKNGSIITPGRNFIPAEDLINGKQEDTAADPFNGKYFRLKHVATGRYLCVEHANTKDGAKVVVANRDDSNANQVWGFSAMDEGFYKIFNQNSKKSIDIGAFSTQAGVEITQHTANGGTNQQVKPVLNEDGTYTLVDFKTDRVFGDDAESVLVERHKEQLMYYKRAVEEMTEKEVSNTYIYSFSLMKEIEIV
jgi:hypothetical protein